MSNHARNTEEGVPGGTIVFDIWFRAYSGGPLINCDTVPTYTIYDPSNNVLETGSATNVSQGYYTVSYNIPITAAISNLYRIEWNAKINTFTVQDAWEYFRVLQSGSPSFSTIVITAEDLNQIKKIFAYPTIDSSDTPLLTDDNVKEYCVKPALHKYFMKFPIRVDYSASINGQMSIDFPDVYTFGVLDCRVVDTGTTVGTGSSFWDVVAFQSIGGATYRGGQYGRPYYNPNGLFQQRTLQRFAIKSLQNLNTTLKYQVDLPNRKLIAYSNVSGTLNVSWAKLSYDFSAIKAERKFDVIKLAQSEFLYYIVDHFSVINDTNLEININIDALKTRAQELKEEVDNRWMEIPDVIVLRAV